LSEDGPLTTLGRYRLVRLLGRGGSGEVWEAVLQGPAGFRRRVAVKLLPERVRTSALQEAFVHEARLGGLVHHPNVVATQELTQHEGRWLLVMDLVRGTSARALRKRGPLPPQALLELGVQLCRGLDHIHRLTDEMGQPLGLVHRDIKPANVLVSEHGHALVADLGIARLVGSPGQPAGTRSFMAPEQYEGAEGPAADVFGLGATLAYLVLGRPPLGRGAKATMRAHRADLHLADDGMRRALDGCVPGLAKVLARAMRVDPSARWASAEAFGQALSELHAGAPPSPHLRTLCRDLPTEPEVSSRSSEASRFVGRRRELAALVARLDADRERIVVVKGPAGVGKTRLVDEAVLGREAVRCDATSVVTGPAMCRLVAQQLGVALRGDPVAGVAEALVARGPTLVVLDNLEQVAEPAVVLLRAWHAAAPRARFLCTSRVALPLSGSVEFRLGPLSTAEAVELLRLRMGREVDDQMAQRLVRQVERLPLAVELVAAQARLAGAEAVLRRLEDGRAAGWLDAQLDASWRLLDASDRRALVMLAAFEGGFDHKDAAAVLGPEGDALQRLSSLVDHSLLQVRRNAFRMLASVRRFARKKGGAAWSGWPRGVVAGHRGCRGPRRPGPTPADLR